MQIDPSKIEEASNPEIAGPSMMKGSFEQEVDSDDDNLNEALAQAKKMDQEEAHKDDDKKESKE